MKLVQKPSTSPLTRETQMMSREVCEECLRQRAAEGAEVAGTRGRERHDYLREKGYLTVDVY